MKTQVALVSIKGAITPQAYDKALFFNGEYLISADSDWKQFESIELLALNLAKANQVDVTEITYPVDTSNWRWCNIAEALLTEGKLAGLFKTVEIDHTFIDAEGDIHSNTAGFKAQSFDHAVGQLIDEYKNLGCSLLTVENPNKEETSVLYQTGESDYHLMPQTSSSCWITVGSASVYVKQEGEGVVVDVYPLNGEANESVASTYAHFTECLPETETA